MQSLRHVQPASDLLRLLKQATENEHLAIERTVRFLDPGATVLDYRAYLARMLGYVAPLEARLAQVCAAAPALEIEARQKSQQIAHDLWRLGLRAREIAALPGCRRLPDVRELQRALGCLYVLEGSTLGGKYIEHRLWQLHASGLTGATTYLRCYGPSTGERWIAFGAALAQYATDPEIIVAAARDTFVTLSEWLAEPTA